MEGFLITPKSAVGFLGIIINELIIILGIISAVGYLGIIVIR